MTTATEATFEIKAGDFTFSFLNSGDVYKMSHGQTMINQLASNPIDGSLNNIYLRLHQLDGVKAYPLLGVRSGSKVHHTDKQVIWEGAVEGVSYEVTLTLTKQGIWFWDVVLDGEGEADLVYGQDVGIAHQGAVRTNEAFTSQYIDHKVFDDSKLGYVICSRQNQPNGKAFPYLQQGSLNKSDGFSTDGFQFFGLSYKETDEPEALKQEHLANEVYQYEFAYIALQSEKVELNGKERFVFYGVFKEDHPAAVMELEFSEEVQQAWEEVQKLENSHAALMPDVELSEVFAGSLQTVEMTEKEIQKLYPERILEEREGDALLSFFTPEHDHVVLPAKERIVERPHGHILVTGETVHYKPDTITTTSYMYGVFNSQLVVGNTSFHKMLTNTRNALNITKTSGQRIYVERDGRFYLLTMPSLFEMGFNYARWYYKTEDDTIIITNFTTVDTPEVQLQVTSQSGKSYRYLVTNQVSMNNMEYDVPFHMHKENNVLTFTADQASDSAKTYPYLRYRMKVDGAEMSVSDERIFGKGMQTGSASLVVLDVQPAAEWKLTVQGLIDGQDIPFAERDAEQEVAKYRDYMNGVKRGFRLSQHGEETEELQKMNVLSSWYTHNMMIHYSVPHGLEQYGGAAWGTRDVCQGPTEYFLAMQHHDAVRDILLTVYTHQYESTGNWPQWFMFDEYHKIQQEESHGDIIVWPLKAVTEYLVATHDFSILEENVPYTDSEGFGFTEKKETLYEHIQKQIQYIKNNFLHDTHLSSYGDGDWDDTLQPANPDLKQYLISSWTVALTYQTITQFSKLLENVNGEAAEEMTQLSQNIKDDFQKYMLQDDVIPGFVYMEKQDEAKLMLHPTDDTTGVQYRLLPMTRSMIAELLTAEQAQQHYDLICEKFYCPDGVRLMNKPAQYKGGVSTHFKRAEQASNFGREVGLQYVHAHIRFVEAMAKLGKTDEVWRGLNVINPVGIQDAVPNAERRQSNAYFSSSDGDFKSRYEAEERFGELKTGDAKVKGGWRIYSSGPGIYMNQLISNCLGIRTAGEDLIIDPVLPDSLDGLEFRYVIDGKPVTFHYHLHGEKSGKVVVNHIEAESVRIENRYRKGGMRVQRSVISDLLNQRYNVIHVYM
ncbi:GH36-type glycosyl hydrolase domain-containing protein [Fictibacillus aquaticus]|uniref:Cellobiose phosphorylase n=1 Tax=Fictibacillus aquaticus TaxID=2021314 RepID=A0A235FD57_9BACL|nr:amylo-alpha-1,6-glucosidase [Fictibacillus aquaticus]OYD59320.1 cellobiose phosphorylase [Fictibacillus aquaticus]